MFQDEVDLNLNPDIGCMWMQRGEQAEVVTPGNNVKRYLSGSMSWRTGELVVTQGTRRNAELFVAHLEDLRRRFRYCRRIHVICDRRNAYHDAAAARAMAARYGRCEARGGPQPLRHPGAAVPASCSR